jgi:hypothetical protein
MSQDPHKDSKERFERLPESKRIEILVLGAWRGTGDRPWPSDEWPWLSQGTAQAYLQRLSIEQTVRLVKVTKRLEWLTIALTVLTAILAVPIVRNLW